MVVSIGHVAKNAADMNWAFQNSNSSVPEEVFGGELMIAEPASIIHSIENSSKSTSRLASEQTLGFRDGSAIFDTTRYLVGHNGSKRRNGGGCPKGGARTAANKEEIGRNRKHDFSPQAFCGMLLWSAGQLGVRQM
jgi:hypothetical protein